MRIRILLIIWVMRICDHWFQDPPRLQFEPPVIHWDRPRPSSAFLTPGSWIQIRDDAGSYFRKLRNNFLGQAYLILLCGSGSGIRNSFLPWIRDGKIRIRDKHSGSVTLTLCMCCRLWAGHWTGWEAAAASRRRWREAEALLHLRQETKFFFMCKLFAYNGRSVLDPWHFGKDPRISTVPLSNGSGCGSGRPKNIRIPRIRIRNTGWTIIKKLKKRKKSSRIRSRICIYDCGFRIQVVKKIPDPGSRVRVCNTGFKAQILLVIWGKCWTGKFWM